MKCPFCGAEMNRGYVQSGTHIVWTAQKRRVSQKSGRPDEILLAQDFLGGAAVDGFCCPDCKKIVLDYAEIGFE